MKEPMAFLLTWRTYGTWLHGDPRGSVDKRNNVPGTPLIAPNPSWQGWNTAQLRESPCALDAPSQEVVASAIRDHCRVRRWQLLALAVRTNHVHAVLENAGVSAERMMGQLKAWSTRRLREAGRAQPRGRVWAHHGSTRYLWDARQLNAAVAYVEEGQDVPRY